MIFVFVTLLVLGTDQLTKYLVFNRMLSNQDNVEIFGRIMSFSRATNTGGPFGMFGAYGKVFFIMAMIFIVALVIYRVRTGKHSRYMDLCLGLLLAGALGNWIDRIHFHYVRDFINFHFWPVFNVADMSITAGVLMLLGFLVWDGYQQPPPADEIRTEPAPGAGDKEPEPRP